jgi:hypothetical protein
MVSDYVLRCLEVVGAIHATKFLIVELKDLWLFICGKEYRKFLTPLRAKRRFVLVVVFVSEG